MGGRPKKKAKGSRANKTETEVLDVCNSSSNRPHTQQQQQQQQQQQPESWTAVDKALLLSSSSAVAGADEMHKGQGKGSVQQPAAPASGANSNATVVASVMAWKVMALMPSDWLNNVGKLSMATFLALQGKLTQLLTMSPSLMARPQFLPGVVFEAVDFGGHLLDISPSGVQLWAPPGSSKAALVRQLGSTQGGLNSLDFIQDQMAALVSWMSVLDSSNLHVMNKTFVTPQGEFCYIALHYPIHDDDNHVCAVGGVLLPIDIRFNSSPNTSSQPKEDTQQNMINLSRILDLTFNQHTDKATAAMVNDKGDLNQRLNNISIELLSSGRSKKRKNLQADE